MRKNFYKGFVPQSVVTLVALVLLMSIAYFFSKYEFRSLKEYNSRAASRLATTTTSTAAIINQNK